MDALMHGNANENNGPSEAVEIAFVGDLSDNEAELTDKLLSVPVGGRCTLYIDSPGGGPYCAISLTTLLLTRQIHATAIVTGECSSAAIWPFAACKRRLVTPYSVLLFHPMKWQSDERIELAEAAEWARHFENLELEMDSFLAQLLDLSSDQLDVWNKPGRYVSGRELVDKGLAEMLDLRSLAGRELHDDHTQPKPRLARRTKTVGNA